MADRPPFRPEVLLERDPWVDVPHVLDDRPMRYVPVGLVWLLASLAGWGLVAAAWLVVVLIARSIG